MAEAILNKDRRGKIPRLQRRKQPKGKLHPETLRVLKSLGYNMFDVSLEKSWAELYRR